MIRQLKNLYISLRYGGNRFKCHVCGGRFRQLLPLTAKWFVRNELIDHYTPQAICPQCGSWVRHRFLVKLMEKQQLFANHRLKLLHFAPEDHLTQYFKTHFPALQYFCGDIDIARYQHLNALEIDIRQIEQPDQSFDALICYHVLELIDTDQKAISEMYRILKHGGWAIIAVPIYGEKTYENLTASPEEREKLFGYPYNYRLYGLDLVQQLEKAGFEVKTYQFEDFEQDYYDPSVRSPHLDSDRYVFLCRKK